MGLDERQGRGEEMLSQSLGEAAVQALQSVARGFVRLREAFPWRGFEIQPLIRNTADLLSVAVRESFTIVNQEN